MALESWDKGYAYEQYIGRWSRHTASRFLAWLQAPSGLAWGDVGCGVGALAQAILAEHHPEAVHGIDQSREFLSAAHDRLHDRLLLLAVADAAALPWKSASLDVAVSGLVLNFVPHAAQMVSEMVRVSRPQGRVAAYVWDYGGGMQMIRHFWDAAIQLDPQTALLDQAERFPLCQPGPLQELFLAAGLSAVRTQAIDIPTVFRDFDDYWTPFLGRQGSAPAYVATLDDPTRDELKNILRARLKPSADGAIRLMARAWAVQGVV